MFLLSTGPFLAPCRSRACHPPSAPAPRAVRAPPKLLYVARPPENRPKTMKNHQQPRFSKAFRLVSKPFQSFCYHPQSFFLGAAFTCGSGRLAAGCTGAKGIVGATTLDLSLEPFGALELISGGEQVVRTPIFIDFYRFFIDFPTKLNKRGVDSLGLGHLSRRRLMRKPASRAGLRIAPMGRVGKSWAASSCLAKA